jgi:AraC-like DNA-binding protein
MQADGMTYVRHIPSPPLDRYISHFYYLDGHMPYPRERILPLTILDLKINLGGAFTIFDADDAQHAAQLTESWLVGLYNRPHTIVWPDHLRLYGVRFKPGGAYPFLGAPVFELHNLVVPLDAVWKQFAAELRERLDAAPSVEAGLALFERLIRERLNETPYEQRLVEYGVAEIERQRGMVSINALSQRIGVSQNHLLTQFKRVVGTSAKEAARLSRFEHVLRAIDPTQPIDWTWVAHQHGYYDQSHLNKDFVTYTGYSPPTYVRFRSRVYTGGALVDRLSLRTLPTD